MQDSLIIGLFQNIAILLAFTMLYVNFWLHNEESKTLIQKIITGILVGGIGIVLMYTPWSFIPGIVFDTRSIMLSISGLFFGPIPTIIAMITTGIIRLIIGGDGAYMGIAVIVSSGTIGILWREFRPHWREKNIYLELLSLGLIVHIVMLACTFLLPADKYLSVINTIVLPLLFIYSPGTMLLGILMLRQSSNYKNLLSIEKLNLKLNSALDKAKESEKLKSAFLTNMSHEIRTPLNGILGFLELLKEHDVTVKQQDAYFNIVNKSSERLLNTINDIIEISKIESGQSPVQNTSVDLNEVFEYLYDFFKPEAQKKELSFISKNQFKGEPFIVKTDKFKLESILSNLLKNAFKFTSKGFVEFGSTIQNETISFYIKDSGIGIPESRINSIFNRFEQVETSNTRLYEGSGLGLSISKAYANILGGEIKIESEEGKGSSFYFSYTYTKADKDEFVGKEDIPLRKNNKERLILIAEDDDTSFSFLKTILEGENFKVIRAITGKEIVKRCKDNPHIELLLLDIRMPEIDGHEAARQIRLFNQHLPIIAQTAYAFSDDREKSLAAGCNDYIAKPITKNSLLKKVYSFLDK